MLLGVLAPWPFFLLGYFGCVDACSPTAVALDLFDLAGEIVIDLPTGADECHEGAGAAGGVVEVDKDALGALIPDFDRVFERIDGADGILCDKKFVSIRAPREGRDGSLRSVSTRCIRFQSARPVKGATASGLNP